jgi:phosphoglycolate phosphatase-like HAD superfamily hydrolase
MTIGADRMKLVLFDIDGTLLRSDGAGRRAIHKALMEVFGSVGPDSYWFDGKTDRQIVRDLMRLDGHEDAHIDARMDPLLTRYVECLAGELAKEGFTAHLLEGVGDLLTALEARDDVILGLLTGNVEPGARAKLRAVGLDPDRFTVGAFGSDHEHRPALPAIAQQRARDELGVDVAGGDIVVIGDTPADIECARSVDARAIGVATGRFPVEELQRHGAVAVFEDLTDTHAVVQAILDA